MNMLAALWGAEHADGATGCSTIMFLSAHASSRALPSSISFGGMALKWRWRERRRAQGRPTDRPNLVMAGAISSSGSRSRGTALVSPGAENCGRSSRRSSSSCGAWR